MNTTYGKSRRIAGILLAILIVFAFSSCKRQADGMTSSGLPVTSRERGGRPLRLLYSAADTLNPYTAQTELNRKLSLLIFDPLIRLNNNFEAEYVLAQTAEVQNGVCTVKLKSALFTDGTPVTADDVVYSYNLAKASATEYAYELYEVQSAAAVDSKTVAFKLNRNDIYFTNLLCFPILKANSDYVVDADGRPLTPVGSGRYIPDSDGSSLCSNKNYLFGKIETEKITLINAPDEEAVTHYIEIGAADMYYTDESDVSILRMSGKKSVVNLNNLIYIGVNQSYGQLGSEELRQAISSAIDRTVICKEAYHNNAVPAAGFYNPAVKITESVQNLGAVADTKISIENLEKIGYNSLDSAGNRVNRAGNRLRLTLLVNGENAARVELAKRVSEQLGAVGIEVTVVERSFEEYSRALAAGSFQLYVGEVKTLANMDMSQIAIPGGSCAYGLTASTGEQAAAEGEKVENAPSAQEVIGGFYSGNNTITDVAEVLQTELPVIPVCFKQGLLFHSENVHNVGSASQCDIYFSIGEYTVRR